ncbi:MAG TPA: SBBP repeat-containing protein [Terriglobales bacterium]|nr:SBBP repeat-containing protein [Terriglobales bacterium]
MSLKLRARFVPVCLFSLVVLIFCLSTPFNTHAGTTGTPEAGRPSALAANYGNLPLSFERNEGQTDAQVKFLSRGGGYTVFLTSQSAVLVLSKQEPNRTQNARNKASKQTGAKNLPVKVTATVVRLQLAGEKLNLAPKISGLAELPGRSNYFKGSNRQRWATNIPNYEQVQYRGVYPGVDMVYYGNQRQLEYDMVVAPHADPSAIHFQVQGARSMEIAPSGDLILHTTNGDVALRKPLLYQPKIAQQKIAGTIPLSPNEGPSNASPLSSPAADQPAPREMVNGSYVIQGNEIQFQVSAYDNNRPLIIDPVLTYSTFLGGSSFDQGSAIAADINGNAYIAGETNSPDFPTTNTINPFNQAQMVFIAKLSPAGDSLVYSTYLGGANPNDFDSASGIALDGNGNAYVSGTTSDTDFPVVNAYQASPPDPAASNVFVSKLNAAGNSLLYSTYLGGTNNGGSFQSLNFGNSIAADANGNAYVTGNTSSDNFPHTSNAFQQTDPVGLGSLIAVPFVSKIDTTQTGVSSLVYSTYLGGAAPNAFNRANGIATNGLGKVYITGTTNAPDFPTKNAFQNNLVVGSQNAFVSVLDTTASGNASLIYSTYLGGKNGSMTDSGADIVVDSTGKIDVTGITGSTGFPVTSNAFQNSLAGACSNAFISQIDPTQSGAPSLVYSTYFGGNDSLSQCTEEGHGIATDSTGKIYVTGQTDSSNFPTKNPLQAMLPESGSFEQSVFVSQFDPSQPVAVNTLLFSTYLGGSRGSNNGDRGYGVAVDSNGANVYVTGATDAYDFPAVNPLQPYSANGDAFVAKINLAGTSPAILLTPSSLSFDFQTGGTSSTPKPVTVKNVGTASLTISAVSVNFTGFSISGNTCAPLPFALTAGSTCTISVIHNPPQSGNWSANLVITDSSLGSPHKVSLRGAGANVALASSLNPSSYGQTVTFTATLTSGVPGGPLGGTVQFFDGTNAVDTQPVVSGAATFASSTLIPGSHVFTAVYSGDTFRSGNISNAITQVVNQAATTTTLTSSLNPSAFGAGNPPTFTATVTTNNGLTTVEGGTVTFKDGAATLGTSTILPDDTGQTTFTPASNTVLGLGTHPITAIYQGDATPANWGPSTSSVLNQVVKPPTSTTLAAQINGKPAGGTAYFTRNPAQKLILAITVTGNAGTPTGAVTVTSGNVILGPPITLVTVNSTTATATFQVTGLRVGLNQINAVFPPTGPYAGSTSNTVMVYQSPRPKVH